jgi:hypothetical protein
VDGVPGQTWTELRAGPGDAPRGMDGGGRAVGDSFDAERAYVMLVSKVDMRYHVSWYRDYVAAAVDPLPSASPVAVCGQKECEPFDLSRMPMVVACDQCFRIVGRYDDAKCIGAPRRNPAGTPPAKLIRLADRSTRRPRHSLDGTAPTAELIRLADYRGQMSRGG